MSSPVRPFDSDRIAEYLQRQGWSAMRTDTGGFVAWFFSDADVPEIQVRWSAEGPDHDIFTVRTTTADYYRPDDWGTLLGLINTYHHDFRYLKVVLDVMDEPGFAKIHTETHLDLEAGAHDELVDSFAEAAIEAAGHFYMWLGQARRHLAEAPSASELESWLERGA